MSIIWLFIVFILADQPTSSTFKLLNISPKSPSHIAAGRLVETAFDLVESIITLDKAVFPDIAHIYHLYVFDVLPFVIGGIEHYFGFFSDLDCNQAPLRIQSLRISRYNWTMLKAHVNQWRDGMNNAFEQTNQIARHNMVALSSDHAFMSVSEFSASIQEILQMFKFLLQKRIECSQLQTFVAQFVSKCSHDSFLFKWNSVMAIDSSLQHYTMSSSAVDIFTILNEVLYVMNPLLLADVSLDKEGCEKRILLAQRKLSASFLLSVAYNRIIRKDPILDRFAAIMTEDDIVLGHRTRLYFLTWCSVLDAKLSELSFSFWFYHYLSVHKLMLVEMIEFFRHSIHETSDADLALFTKPLFHFTAVISIFINGQRGMNETAFKAHMMAVTDQFPTMKDIFYSCRTKITIGVFVQVGFIVAIGVYLKQKGY